MIANLIFVFHAHGQTTYYLRQSGNWNANATWSTVTYGNTTNTGTFPVAGDIVNIGANVGVSEQSVFVNVASACSILNFLTNAPESTLVLIDNALVVSGVITIPRAANGFRNLLNVRDGVLNAGGIAFTNGGPLGAPADTRQEFRIRNGTATVSGDVTESGSTGSARIRFLAGATGNLQLGGAIFDSSNGRLVTRTGSTVEYNGTVAQIIGDFTYGNLILNNTVGTIPQLTLAGNTIATNTLTMTSGIVNLNGSTLTLGATAASSTLSRTASTTTNWMYGGTFLRFWPAPTTAVTSTSGNYYGLFPVGAATASSYRPVEINSTVNPTLTGSFSVTHVDATTTTDLSPVFDD